MRESHKPTVLNVTKMLTGTGDGFPAVVRWSRRFRLTTLNRKGLALDYLEACSAVDEPVREGTLTDETLSSLLMRYGSVGTRKLIRAIGYFALLAIFLNGCRVPLETSDKIGSSTSPLDQRLSMVIRPLPICSVTSHGEVTAENPMVA